MYSKDAIVSWRVETLDARVDRELDALADDVRASFFRIAQLIMSHGLHRVKEPYVKPLGGKLWEMRLKGKDGIARALYVAAMGRRVVVLHVFVKKTEKTPRQAVDMAVSRAREAGLL